MESTHRMGRLKHYAEGGLIGSIKSLVSSVTSGRKPDDAPIGSGAASQAKQALTGRKQTLDDAERKAVGMKTGGKIRGKGTGTSDDVPIMASNGEYVFKASAVAKLGTKVLDAMNAVGDDPKKPKRKGAIASMAEKKTGVPHMRDGDSVDQARRRVAPYVNHRTPSGPPVMQDQLRLPNNAPAPGTSVATRPGPNFTMGGAPQQPPPAVDPVTDVKAKGPTQRIGYTPKAPTTAVATSPYKPNFTMGGSPPPQQPPAATDVRAKYDPAKGSKEAKAYQADRAANPGPKPAGSGSASQANAPSATKPVARVAQTGRGYGAGKMVGGAIRRMGPAAAGAGIVSSFNDYKINDPEVDSSAGGTIGAIKNGDFAGAGRSLSKGALETAMDLGSAAANAADLVVPGNAPVSTAYDKFLRNQFGDQLAPAPGVGAEPPAPVAEPAPQVPAPVAAPVAAPAPPAGQGAAAAPPAAQSTGAIRRIGNSYSGQNVSGDISINGGAPRGGFVGGSGDGTFTYGGTGGGSGAGGGVSDQALNAARLAAVQRGDIDGVKASYAAQGQDFGPKVDPIDALVNNGKPMTVRKAGAIAALQQAKASQQGATADRKLAQDKFDLEKDGAKLDNNSKAQLASLQTMALDPNTTPEQRKSALAIYRALTGKAETQNRYTVFGLPDEVVDGQVVRGGQAVIDNMTGQRVQQQGAQSGGQKAPPDGTELRKDGKKYVVKNGVPVPV